MSRGRSATAALAVIVALMLSGCATLPTQVLTVSDQPAGAAAATPTPTSARTSAPSLVAALWPSTLQPPSGFTWLRVVSSPALAVATVDRGAVSVMWMDSSLLRFRFVPGYTWPERGPVAPADTQPETWTAHMVAAFNGAFKLADHVGGYYYRGRMVSPLRSGYAAFAVHRDGSLSVGVWGKDLYMTSDLVVVRQNLKPIVFNGVSQTSASDVSSTWGLTLQRLRAVNRSALGQRADGSLVFVFGHLVTPETIAQALIRAGAREAMMLDMNVVWPTGFVYTHTGGHIVGKRINANIKKSPSIYLAQFSKDFVAVESR